jgi:hypothetical protein
MEKTGRQECVAVNTNGSVGLTKHSCYDMLHSLLVGSSDASVS